MKQYLLDTNIILFWFFDSKRLAKVQKKLLAGVMFVSPFSMWEIAIKNQIGKLDLPLPFNKVFDEVEDGFSLINWEKDDLLTYRNLPLHHRDPFDRMIISQAKTRSLCLVSADKQLGDYEIEKIIL